MNLTPCAACGKPVSTAAATCPTCGHPVPRPPSGFVADVALVMLLGFFAILAIVAWFVRDHLTVYLAPAPGGILELRISSWLALLVKATVAGGSAFGLLYLLVRKIRFPH
jgi:hypothetical protein